MECAESVERGVMGREVCEGERACLPLPVRPPPRSATCLRGKQDLPFWPS